ncbi:MAG: diphosphate--fructose-6-phosphate 1-phosphotransferase [Chloroflexi bacterium]|nr:diphosphate--fructose-6-phosphate 1-phosphotransferase [Chloroflexota bacterium]
MLNSQNILIMQSGGCTPVLNRSLYGIVREALSHSGDFREMYGARYGMEGILAGDLIDLRRTPSDEWRRIADTPGAVLGSTRRKMRADDVQPILDTLRRHNIGCWFIIGGNDSATTGHAVGQAAESAGMDIAVINIPKTIDNDLVLTDHSPGYGSAARFVAFATMGAGRDAESMGIASPITVIEVMGRDAGWLAAASAFAKRDDRDAPHFIGLPEVALDETRFLDCMEDTYRRHGLAVAVVAENIRTPDGKPVGEQGEPYYTDDFGHPYYEGPAKHLAALVSARLGVRARHEKPGTIQRSMMACISRTDAQEAEQVGRAAVQHALAGDRDIIVTLERARGDDYACTTGVAPLNAVGGKVKTMPPEYIDPDSNFVTPAFLDYARPLLGDALPVYGRLR